MSARMQWHPYAESFPLLEGAERDALKASLKATRGNKSYPIFFRVVDGKMQGLDGRNRYILLKELRLPVTMKKVAVADEDVEDFVDACNIYRRHLSADNRQRRVLRLRSEGKSTRQIAETIGVSQRTVVNDLKAGEQDCSPQEVKGKDGKSYSSRRKAGEEAGDERPKNGAVLFDKRAFESDFAKVVQWVDRIGNAFGAKESLPATGLRRRLQELHDGFEEWLKALKKGKE